MKEGLVVVLGGAGAVGTGIVQAFTAAGVDVAVPSRNADKLEALRSRLDAAATGTLTSEVLDVNGPEGETFAAQCASRGIRAVVAAIGGGDWKMGRPLFDMPTQDFEQVVRDGLLGHFRAQQLFLPHLVAQRAGTYVMVNGMAAEQASAKYLPMNIVAAAQHMMAQGLDLELRNTGARLVQLMLGPIVSHAAPQRDSKRYYSAREVGERLLAVLDGTWTESGFQYRLASKQ